MPNLLIGPVLSFAEKLRFRTLFFVVAGLFLANVLIPDAIPFIDEILLGLLTILFASWRKKPGQDSGKENEPKD